MSTLTKRRRNSRLVPSDVLASIAEALVQRLPSLNAETKDDIAQALHDLLDGHDELSRDRRSGMQRYLIEVAELQDRIPHHNAAEKMLSTEAAAELMQCSQPYVAMLIDNKKLAGALVTKGEHRRVPEASVRTWIKERDAAAKHSDYRAAAAETDMYAVPETAFIQTKTRPRR